MTSVDADHAIRVIRARCFDAFAPSDLDLIERTLTGSDEETIGDIAERIEDVLAAMEERLAAVETRLETMEGQAA